MKNVKIVPAKLSTVKIHISARKHILKYATTAAGMNYWIPSPGERQLPVTKSLTKATANNSRIY